MPDLPSIPGELVIVSGSLIASAYAVFNSRRAAAQARSVELISAFYRFSDDLFGELRLREWRNSHLLETPENYALATKRLAILSSHLSHDERQELLVRERAVAIRVFSFFESNYYLLSMARKHRDKPSAEFLEEVNTFFLDVLLANPRLRYLWSVDGDNLCSLFEPKTLAAYDSVLGPISGLPAGKQPGTIDQLGPHG